jgi:hypothetical protein
MDKFFKELLFMWETIGDFFSGNLVWVSGGAFFRSIILNFALFTLIKYLLG